ncbi:MAG TPA: hypothetical protein VGF13_22935 [Verrucomicrobiae bacterium]
MAVAGSMEDFNTALAKGSAHAAILGRIAKAADDLSDTFGETKDKVGAMFAGIAEGALPGLQAAAKGLNQIDFTAFGQKLGASIGILTQAIADGELGNLIFLGLGAGIEKAGLFMGNLLGNADLWIGIAETAASSFNVLQVKLLQIFGTASDFFAATITSLLQQVFAGFAGSKMGGLLGLKREDVQVQKFGDIFAQKRAQTKLGEDLIFGDFLKGNEGQLKAGTERLLKAVREAWKNSGGEMGAEFEKKIAEIAGRVPQMFEKLPKPDPNAPPPPPDAKLKFSGKGPDVNALERIGLVRLGGNPAADYARRSAFGIEALNKAAAAQTVLLQKIAAKNLDPGGELLL